MDNTIADVEIFVDHIAGDLVFVDENDIFVL